MSTPSYSDTIVIIEPIMQYNKVAAVYNYYAIIELHNKNCS